MSQIFRPEIVRRKGYRLVVTFPFDVTGKTIASYIRKTPADPTPFLSMGVTVLSAASGASDVELSLTLAQTVQLVVGDNYVWDISVSNGSGDLYPESYLTGSQPVVLESSTW